ncbi:uncharacterized protein LOC123878444 [Maniola jurtina]|uniref:uncharacterized protein LOC123878444 n=1 Tax=Maniola jurtina TaxID=191418 RepID=UPI001E687A81|nr:uncharacterized protein LOC123878444 [Maniola jurtina]
MFSAKPRRSWIGRLLGGVLNGFKSFCLQTSIHGFNHIAAPRRHWIERLLWVSVTAMAACGVVGISLGQWQRYINNPTVVTLDKDYRTWNYTTTAATACEVNRTNPKKVERAIKTRWNVAPNDSNYYYYARFVDVVANSDLYNLTNYEEFKNDPNLNVNLYELAVEVMPDQSVKLSTSGLFSYRPKWVPVMTEVGACYTFNSVAVADVAIIKPATNVTKDIPATCEYTPSGCTYIFECFNLIKYYFHSAFDIVDTQTASTLSIPPQNTKVTLAITETCSGAEVRALSPSRRHCLYFDEPTKPNRQVHSNNICRQDCKSRIAMQACGCKPFYYHYAEGPLCTTAGMSCVARIAHRLATFDNTTCPCVQLCADTVIREISTILTEWLLVTCLLTRIYLLLSIYPEGPLCSTAGMSCVARIAHRLATFDNTTCPCVQLCADTVIREISTILTEWLLVTCLLTRIYLLLSIYPEGPLCSTAGMSCVARIAHHLATNVGSLKTRGVVRYVMEPPRTRYTRHIVFHFQDLVVSFGGAAGLFLGASFISFVEIGYFFIERILRIGGKKTDSKALVKTHRAPPYESRIQELTSIIERQNYYERNYINNYYY